MMKQSYKTIFALSLVLMLSACADIDRSLYSVSNAVAPTDRVTGKRALSITSRQAQIETSNQNADQVVQKYLDAGNPINEKVDAAQYQRLLRVFGRVHAVSHLKDEKWTAYLLPDKEWNAFTMGGTYIFVNKGLMDDIQSDDELAAVIGHEIAHVTANHIYEQSSYTMAAKLNGSKSIKRDGFQSAFTLKNEEEADQVGLMYSTLAGYDPYAASRLWKRMYDNEGDFSAMIIDHPINSQRYQKTAALADNYKQYYMANKINPDSARILETNSVFGSGGNAQPALQAGQGGGLLAALEATSEVMLKNREVKTELSRQQQSQQLLQYVSKSIQISDQRLADVHTLLVSLRYTGTTPIKNLTLMAKAGNETASYHTPDNVQASVPLTAQFRFNTDVSTINPRSIPVGIGHVESQ